MSRRNNVILEARSDGCIASHALLFALCNVLDILLFFIIERDMNDIFPREIDSAHLNHPYAAVILRVEIEHFL
jgi:hypothetical protein